MQDTTTTSEAQPKPAASENLRARKPKDGPYCWCCKAALRRIREACDSLSYLAQALVVYLVHCEFASDAHSPTYTVTRRKIAERAGVSVRMVAIINNLLHGLHLLTWKQNAVAGTKEVGPSTYTLLAVDASPPQGMPCTTQGIACTGSGTHGKRQICTVRKESPEESKEEGEGTSPGDQRGTQPKLTAAEHIAAERELPRVEAALKRVRDGASHDATGPMYTKDERSQLRRLKKRRTELLAALGYAA